MNEPTLLAKFTALFTTYILLPMNYVDYDSPLQTALLVAAISAVGIALWKLSTRVRNVWGSGLLKIGAVIMGINVATIFLISLGIWGPF